VAEAAAAEMSLNAPQRRVFSLTNEVTRAVDESPSGRMKNDGARRMPTKLSDAVLAVALAVLPSCATSLSALGTYAPLSPQSGHVGLDLQGHVPLPGLPKVVAGGYAAHVFQVHPATPSDQGRLAAVIGYSAAPTDEPLGFETTLRLGGFRGSNGPLVKLGALSIATVSPVIRLSAPANRFSRFDDVGWALVPYVTGGVLVPFEDVKAELEIGGGLALRAYLGSAGR
jgi:hypothetical protein